jgi:hypothetical protein
LKSLQITSGYIFALLVVIFGKEISKIVKAYLSDVSVSVIEK